MTSNRGLRRALACLASCVSLVFGNIPARATGGGLDADVQIGIRFVSDPAFPGQIPYLITNAGPADAHNVMVRVPIPAPATLRDVTVLEPCRIVTPGIDQSGEVTIEIDRLTPRDDFSIDVLLSLPDEAGTIVDVSAQVSADERDPDPENNTLPVSLSVPQRPTISGIRVLHNPFRLEITGTNLRFRPFGSVSLGCGRVYQATIESEELNGTRVVVGRGKDLMRQVPVGYAAPLSLITVEGARLETTFTRQR